MINDLFAYELRSGTASAGVGAIGILSWLRGDEENQGSGTPRRARDERRPTVVARIGALRIFE